jgi:hypothetical protein
MKNIIKLSTFAILMLMVSSCAIHTGVMGNSAQLSHANFSYVKTGLYGTCQTTRVLGFGRVFKADLVEEAKKDMLEGYELQPNQALANVTVDWKHGRYILVKTTKCSVNAYSGRISDISIDAGNQN